MFDWIHHLIESLGYGGIALLMFLENLFPPIPSELIMPLAGYAASRGAYALPLVIIVGTLGTLVGALPWFYAGRYLGTARLARWAERYGKYAGIRAADVTKADAWFDRHGAWIVLLGRLIPGVRTLISVPAGSCGMGFWPFIGYSAVGSVLWCTGLAWGGWMLGEHYGMLETYIAPFSKIALGLITLGGMIFVMHRLRQQRNSR